MAQTESAEGDWPCRFCGSGDVRAIHMHQKARLPLLRCRACGGYYIPAPAVDFESYYNTTYADAHRRQYLKEHEAEYESGLYDSILGILRQSAPKKHRIRIMDFGCGYAFLLKKASEMGMDTVGVEYDAEIRRYNREELGIETIESPDGAEDGSLDVIYASHVVEHLPDPVSALRGLASKLSENGVLAMTSPCFSPLIAGSDALRIKDMVWPEHVSFFTLKAAEKALERAGLGVETAVTQFADGAQALSHLGAQGVEAGDLVRVLEEAPFHAGSNLFAVAKKAAPKPSDAPSARIRATNLLPGRGMHRTVSGESWEIRIPAPRGESAKAVVCGNAIVLSVPGTSWARIGAADMPPNGRLSFELEADRDLFIAGGGDAEIFLYDVVMTEAL